MFDHGLIRELAIHQRAEWYPRIWKRSAELQCAYHGPLMANRCAGTDRSALAGVLLFHLLAKLYERTRVVLTTNLSFSEWATGCAA